LDTFDQWPQMMRKEDFDRLQKLFWNRANLSADDIKKLHDKHSE
jgi:hypothetical protein